MMLDVCPWLGVAHATAAHTAALATTAAKIKRFIVPPICRWRIVWAIHPQATVGKDAFDDYRGGRRVDGGLAPQTERESHP
jgi:hypothetical protein